MAWLGLAWLGLAWLGLAWLGLAWLGLAWLGLAWLGLAWLGLAWLGLANKRAALSVSVAAGQLPTTSPRLHNFESSFNWHGMLRLF